MSTLTLKSVTCFVISFGLVLSRSCDDPNPPLLCWTGTRSTTGLNANTEYSVTRLSDCAEPVFPPYHCTGLPGGPKNVFYNGSKYDFNVYWNASMGAGGERSALKGFKLQVDIEPCDGSPLPSKCFYVNITKTRNVVPLKLTDALHKFRMQYVLGMFLFSCNYTQQGDISVLISSYPTPEMCSANVTIQEPETKFFVPIVTEPSVSTWMSSLHTTAAPDPVKNIVILTSLAVSFVFILILIAVICMWKRPCKAQMPLARLTSNSSYMTTDSSNDNVTHGNTNGSAEVRPDKSEPSTCQHGNNVMNENVSVNNIFHLPDEPSQDGLKFNGEGIQEYLNADGNVERNPELCRNRGTLPVLQSEWKDMHQDKSLQVNDSLYSSFDNGNNSRYQQIEDSFRDILPVIQSEWMAMHQDRKLQVNYDSPYSETDNGNNSRHQQIEDRFRGTLPFLTSEWMDDDQDGALQVNDGTPYSVLDNSNDSRHQQLEGQSENYLDNDITEQDIEEWNQFTVNVNMAENID